METALELLKEESYGCFKPYSAVIELTYRCNFKCIQCYIPSNSRIQEDELTFDEIKDLLDQCKDMGIIFMTFTGGEPFVREDFLDILEYAYKKGFMIKIKTNGSLIKEEIAKKLSELKIQEIDVTIYGADSETYKTITGNGAAFKKTIDALGYLKKYDIKVLGQFTALKENIDQAEEIVELVEEYDFEPKYTCRINPSLDDDETPLKHACFNTEKIVHLIKAFKGLDKTKKKNQEWTHPKGKLCDAGYSGPSISPSGEVYPCIERIFYLGSIKDKKLNEIWNDKSTNLKKIRELNNFKSLKKCQKCELVDYCGLCLKHIPNCKEWVKEYARRSKKIKERLNK